ncbi:MAG TPA: glutamine-hydrolyzing carbamoyl-phosphate synthase small subunit [Candidatus Eisenbacteria bacterium]|nr:glutamine-hydrolyzing carbamoyl-phosphate synthase small subunit [Candidatus Eisenbacteria bacterium]
MTHPEEVRATLALEDGMCLQGYGFGRQGETSGEVVFQTALSGYQEVLTDPSYLGQIVVMTYPHIGNYGVNLDDVESARPQVAGFVVREASTRASSWRASGELHRYLDEAGIVGIQGLDTRALTRHIRTQGAKRGVISTVEHDPAVLVAKARCSRSMIGLDLAREATCAEAYRFSQGPAGWREPVRDLFAPPRDPFHVVAYDFGMKRNILRHLVAGGCEVTVVPATTTAAEALALGPDGIFFSNGPGDPEPCEYAVEAARELIQERPVFGICLGHQILGLACGGKTFKLKFGHRGANHPVKNLRTGQVEITSQNHGFAVDPSLFDDPAFELTHVNLNDGTVEGFRHRDLPVFSVQYHPEASPGPHDSHYLFREFIAEMAERRDGGSITVVRGLPPAIAAGAGS